MVDVEVPGVPKENIRVECTDGVLSISGEKSYEVIWRQKSTFSCLRLFGALQSRDESGGRVNRVERSYGSFRRAISLPDSADVDNINAKFQNGVLTINIQKLQQEERDVKKIDIQ